jgi:anti-anti-sigma factor
MELTAETIGSFTVFKLAGRIDWAGAGRLDNEIGRHIEAGSLRLAFNLDAVTCLSSGGIGAIAFNTNLVRSRGGAVHIISSNRYINDLFETLKLTLVFKGSWHPSPAEFEAFVLNTGSGSPL